MSRELRNLLKQNRNLEEKLFYEPREDDWREAQINSKELSEGLSYLAKRILNNQDTELSILKMINEVDKLKGRPLPAFEKNALQVVEIAFNYLRANAKREKKFYHVLNSLQLAFTRLSLNDLSFLDNPKHVAVKFLNKLTAFGTQYDNNAGKLAQFFIQAVELLVDRLANREQVTGKTFAMADKMLSEYIFGFNDKVNTNVVNVLAEADRQNREIEAEAFTEKLIKSKTQGEEIPIFLLDFFENQMSPFLYQTIKQHGVKSKQTQQLLTDMDSLAWSVTASFGDPDYETRYAADVTPAMKRIYNELNDIGAVNDYITDFFREIEDMHARKLRGERVEFDVMISADIFADEDYEKDEVVYWNEDSGKAFFDIDSLHENSWYFLDKESEQVRCKLLNKNPLTQQLIFTNLSGELVCTIRYDDTDYLANHLTPIQSENKIEFKHAIKALIVELQSRLEILKSEYENFLNKRAKDKKQQIEQEEKSRIAVQQQLAEEKRLLQIKQAEEAKRKLEQAAEARRLEEMDAKQRFIIKGNYRKLKPGAQVAYKTESGKWTEASLMLISKTTQRHIFTDSKGNKVAEPDKDEVFQLFKTERLKILKEATSAQDPLTSLVKQRREKLSGS
ncbi:DUF1631 family protein [Aliikangiella sp. IMCC44632]